MTPETLTCANGITPEQLSALRDDGLRQGEAARLRAHIPTCPACQARIADMEALADALRSQRELEPGSRIVDDLHARIASGAHLARGLREGRPGNRRRLWAGLAAMAPVAALILIFVYVFSPAVRGPGPAATASTFIPPTPQPTGTPSRLPIYPTATTSNEQPPTYTQAVTAASAWGGFSPSLSRTFAPNGSSEFIPGPLSASGAEIGGVMYDTNANQAQLAFYTLSTDKITLLSPTWRGYAGSAFGGVVSIDSHYIVYGYNSEPGATCGVCNSTLWSLDRITGATWQINAGLQGDLGDFASGEYLVFQSADAQVWVADLATHSVARARPAYATDTPIDRPLGFQWPYLLYTGAQAATPSAAQPPTTLNILDLATGAVTIIAAPMLDQAGDPVDFNRLSGALLLGNTLYAAASIPLNTVEGQPTPSYGALYRLDDTFTPGGAFTALAVWPESENGSGQIALAGHIIALDSGYFWDTAQARLVSSTLTSVGVEGNDLVVVDAQPPYAALQTFHFTAYDTTTFPT